MANTYSVKAMDYFRAGITTLPVIKKSPCVKGFNKWRGVNESTVISFGDKFPDADIAILTRLSNIIVVDVDSDDPSLLAWVADEFGYSPLWVQTSRGYHIYYSNPEGIGGCIGERKSGVDEVHNGVVDLKGAGASDYVVAPPSEGYSIIPTTLAKGSIGHQKDSISKFLELIEEGLPPLNVDGLPIFFPHHPTLRASAENDNQSTKEINVAAREESPREPNHVAPQFLGDSIPEGSRNSSVWRWGMKLAAKLGNQIGHSDHTFDLFHSSLFEFNLKYCVPPLSKEEVLSIATSVWFKYELKGKNHFHVSHDVMMRDIVLTVEAVVLSTNEPSAFSLLYWLKSHYNEDDTFILNRPGLARITGMGQSRLQSARTYLIANDYVVQLTQAKFYAHNAATFKFSDKSNKLISRVSVDLGVNDNDIFP